MKESERLRAALALIDSPEKWAQGASAKDSEGFIVALHAEDAVSFCSLGALGIKCSDKGYLDNEAYESSRTYLKRAAGQRLITEYNDTRTHAEVMQMFDKAIQLAQAEGN
jgi:hypothetical protein